MASAARKVVTVLFCDVVEFTSLGDDFDPERLRHVMTRFFAEMQRILEQHGATVEKFAGDDVMAVFGVPTVHEDDALRAVRAAAEMMRRLDTLNDELERSAGTRLQIRIGINTGEVVAGDHSRGHGFVTGDVVNLAKRLQTAAEPGQILIGKATYPLVQHAVQAGPLQTFKVKGKADPVSSLRVDAVDAQAETIARRLDAPLVGRRDELETLRAAFERVERRRTCELVTLLGVPGIGKSRLAAELAAQVRGRARVVRGRCLAYGEGITYWPLAEIVRQLGGADALELLLEESDDRAVIAERVRSAIGASPSTGTTEETFWAVRRLFEIIATRSPLVVCVEDIHWAEPTLLDLIEYLLGWSHDAPILVLCLARPDLLETRPTWLTPRPNAAALQLEPLPPQDADALFDIVRGGLELPAGARDRIAQVAEGNPLYVEQMVRMVAETPSATAWRAIPPTVQAVLAERLDRLTPTERAVVEHAAVVGREFLRTAVVELVPPELRAMVSQELLSLARKGLVTPDRAALARDDGFRFRHVLIRDAAYQGMSKERRGELHEQYADWLEGNAAHRGELEEIIGFHLEQAYTARSTLGYDDDHLRRLGARAAAHLGAAGDRAFSRGDVRAAATLLTRATALARDDDETRIALAPRLGQSLMELGELERADGVLAAAIETASTLQNDRDAARAEVIRAFVRLRGDPGVTTAELERLAVAAIETFRDLGDDLGAAQAARLLGHVHARRNDWSETVRVLEDALHHAERSRDSRERGAILNALAASLYVGPTPVPEAVRRCRELITQGRGDRPFEASTDGILAALEAMRGRFFEARELAARARAGLEELGVPVWLAKTTGFYTASVELLAGDAAAAEAELRDALERLEDAGDRDDAARVAAVLADALCTQGRLDEAEEVLGDRFQGDLITQIVSDRVHARVRAARGDAEAIAFARKASAAARRTDALNVVADALAAEAEVLRALGAPERWAQVADEAVRLYERKGNVVSARRARAAFASAA